ncbi:putative toxin-antitoxin system toxin component, PIN family [Dyadobacter sp. CY343]|uniref:putative toxin-antitoxin system toxin component, PIN family n=1 Tax=Dyadobacter sp. CY343 TaxID=2907299 RepID=UPI001F1B867A|nr:putative toxin-antitoxin system toxin component, PIN family [Dyadobacter sp. CY343]MCE7058492.1 putative toxin-antitoxin system toxin component, PIN family [Dyadobacter sp. CY343]
MNVVIDTNVLLVSLPGHSNYHPIFQALLNKDFDMFISNEILAEYEEQIGMRLGVYRTDLHLIELVNLSNVHKIESYFLWQLIEVDKDDNKFVDCAISCNADYLVTNDGHFNILAEIEFPKVNVVTAQKFLQIIKDTAKSNQI